MQQFERWNGRLIWSADNMDWPQLYEILKRDDFPRDEVAVKLDRLFLTKYGLERIDRVQELGIPVFADAKIVEIPSKTMEIVKLHLEHRPWMLNVMAQVTNTGVSPQMYAEKITDGGLDVLNDFARECKEVGTKPCVVTVLTSKTRELVEYEYDRTTEAVVFDYTKLALSCGVTDIVCSPMEAEDLRRDGGWTSELKLNTPGVRLKDSLTDDQRRVATPGEALAKGADRLVIGRDLSRNGDFQGNLQKILADIEAYKASGAIGVR